MSQILSELTTRAPVIQKQKEEYQRVVQSHDQLASRLDEAHRSRNEMESEIETLRKKIKMTEKEKNEARQAARGRLYVVLCCCSLLLFSVVVLCFWRSNMVDASC